MNINIEAEKQVENQFSSNSIRLSMRQWIFAAAFCIAAIVFIPSIWESVENFTPGQDYRQPYDLSSDYWLYQRYSKFASSEYETVIIGDSVVWGHYVSKDNTLSHYLNELSGSNNVANLGADGMHPAALEGLVRYYCKDIKNKKVILHLNLLWMTSPKADLQTEKETKFNHPKLVSQFITKIPCYTADYSERFSIALKRSLGFTNLVSHLNINYFDNMDMSSWTLENPYKNPFNAEGFDKAADNYGDSEGAEDSERNLAVNNFQWVSSQTSIQWKSFKRTIKLLQDRGNDVVILVGPFNENMIDTESMENYQVLKNDIEQWFGQNNIAFFVPQVLPVELYNDASHPNAEGYKMIAQELLGDESFSNIFFAQ